MAIYICPKGHQILQQDATECSECSCNIGKDSYEMPKIDDEVLCKIFMKDHRNDLVVNGVKEMIKRIKVDPNLFYFYKGKIGNPQHGWERGTSNRHATLKELFYTISDAISSGDIIFADKLFEMAIEINGDEFSDKFKDYFFYHLNRKSRKFDKLSESGFFKVAFVQISIKPFLAERFIELALEFLDLKDDETMDEKTLMVIIENIIVPLQGERAITRLHDELKGYLDNIGQHRKYKRHAAYISGKILRTNYEALKKGETFNDRLRLDFFEIYRTLWDKGIIADSLLKHMVATFCTCCEFIDDLYRRGNPLAKSISKKKLLESSAFHDLGKSGFLLTATERSFALDMALSEQELLRIKEKKFPEHVEIIDSFLGNGLKNIIKNHHENIDGTGYFKTDLSKIPNESKIIRIVDSAQKIALGEVEVDTIINNLEEFKGKYYDKKFLELFYTFLRDCYKDRGLTAVLNLLRRGWGEKPITEIEDERSNFRYPLHRWANIQVKPDWQKKFHVIDISLKDMCFGTEIEELIKFPIGSRCFMKIDKKDISFVVARADIPKEEKKKWGYVGALFDTVLSENELEKIIDSGPDQSLKIKMNTMKDMF